jgi:hypothetical protein
LHGRGELRLHLITFLLQGLHARADRIEVADALGDGVDQALQLAGDFAGAACQVFFAVAVLPRQAKPISMPEIDYDRIPETRSDGVPIQGKLKIDAEKRKSTILHGI